MVNKLVNKATKIPEHQSVYQQLRNLLLLGKLEPGQPLTIMGLAETLNVGMTPVREALRRLSAENAVSTLENRRIISLHDLRHCQSTGAIQHSQITLGASWP